MTRHRRTVSTGPSKEWLERHPAPPSGPRPPRQLSRRITPGYGTEQPTWWETLPPWLLTAVGVLLILLVAATEVLDL
jgi:hypothetical protein